MTTARGVEPTLEVSYISGFKYVPERSELSNAKHLVTAIFFYAHRTEIEYIEQGNPLP